MEVTDPYTNTTTVKNILQHIIVPKIVNDGSNGYVTKTDLVNVHNIIFSGHSTTAGTESAPNTSQSGRLTTTTQSTTVYHSRVTTNSVIMACTMDAKPTDAVLYVRPLNGSFIIYLANNPVSTRIGWFIAHF